MYFTYIFLLFTILLSPFFSIGINAQNDISQQNLFNQIYSAAEQEYGIDQEFVNGEHFENIYLHAIGHPYFLADTFLYGNIVFRGKQYSDLLLKYDLFSQQLLINYDFNNYQVQFYLPEEFVSEFKIENKRFVNGSIPGEENERIYQIIGEESPVKIIYTWEKFRTISYHYISPSYEFSEEIKSCFIFINGHLSDFNRNRSFVRNFPKQDQKFIKTYIRENKIKIKRSTDIEINSLIKYYNSLNHSALY